MTQVSVDLILDTLKEWVENKQPIDASTWLDAAQKLTVLIGDVQEELFLLEQVIAKQKLQIMEEGKSVAYAKVVIETTDDYVKTKMLEAKIEKVVELIRISKLQARMSDDNLKNYK